MKKVAGIVVCAFCLLMIWTLISNLIENNNLQTTREPDEETAVASQSPENNVDKETHEKEESLSKEMGFDIEKVGEPFPDLIDDLLQILRGTEEDTIFSEKTAGMLNGVTITDAGTVIIDFKDFRDTIVSPTSAEKGKLARELHSVVFSYPEVSKVYYKFNGSASAWWHWLEAYPGPITREDWIDH